MKSKIRSLSLFALLFFMAPALAEAGRFLDVSDSSSYATSISYLADVGVIQGYPDQTFRPDQPVNRVEFLKLVLESSDIVADVGTPTPFPDIDESAWYGKYVRKARDEGWIEGYPDGTFKPQQNINKVEALKIIGEVQGWELSQTIEENPFSDITPDEWFTPYVAYAKNRNFLEERTSRYFPELLLSRAQISELLFRAYITRKSGSDEYSQTLPFRYPPSTFVGVEAEETSPQAEPVVTEEKEFTPYAFENYAPDFFDNVTLSSSFPNIFYENEVYYVEGTIHSGSHSTAFVFLAPEGNENPEEYANYVSEIENGTFRIPVTFRETGNFKMGLILGNSGESKIVDVSVLPDLPDMPSSATLHKPLSPKVQYKNEQTTFSWNNNDADFIKLTVSQDSNKKMVFYFRQNIQSYDVDYTDFQDFTETTTYFSVEGADLQTTGPLEFSSNWSLPSSQSFQATEHNYSEILDSLITLNSFQGSLDSVQAISFSGTTNADIFREVAVTRPDGFVDLFNIEGSGAFTDYYGADVIPKGNSFTFQYQPQSAGTYLVELNGIDGSAVINTPVYVKNGVPLTPDFFDLNLYTQPTQNFDLGSARNELLNLINEERKAVGLPAVTLDNDLNKLALSHSNDMVERKFFGHINPDGETPNDRRIKFGIPVPVGENLAISPTVLYTHKGLMQSGIHRANILDPAWTRVGLGITQNGSGALYTAQEFASQPYAESDLTNIEQNLLNAINATRSNANLSSLTIGNDVQYVADEWSKKMADQNFFDFTSPNGESLSDLVAEYAPGKVVQALILESASQSKLLDEAASHPEIIKTQWRKTGIGVKNDSTGTLKVTILLTTS